MTNIKSSTKILLIRHGVTDWIEQGLIHGISDRPLSSFGLEQADLTAKALKDTKATRMFVSPLLRTRQTAQAIEKTTGLKSEFLDNLMERDFGWGEGKRSYWQKIKDHKFLLKLNYFFHEFTSLFSGENHKDFRQRVMESWKYIHSQAKGGDELIIVAHAGVLRTILLEEVGDNNPETEKFFISTCSISEIEINAGQPSQIIKINDISHLNGKVNS